MKRMKIKLKESFNLFLMKIYSDFSEITQIKMCLSTINHEDEKYPCYIFNKVFRIRILM
jgi:hypothetical protein